MIAPGFTGLARASAVAREAYDSPTSLFTLDWDAVIVIAHSQDVFSSGEGGFLILHASGRFGFVHASWLDPVEGVT